jgi:hypothetical protein
MWLTGIGVEGIMTRSRKLFVSFVALSLIATLTGRAEADMITVVGVDSGAYSTALVNVVFNAQTNTLTFTGTNTSAITQPGSTSTITAFGFDLAPIGSASLSGLNGFSGAQSFSVFSSFTFSDAALGIVPHGFGAPPPVVPDFGFLTGADFASGQVSLGLLPGESGIFTVTGAAFSGFAEAEIANAIFVRFQNVPGIAGSGGSDVGVSDLASLPTPIPEPATTSLVAMGLLGVARALKRRTSARQ